MCGGGGGGGYGSNPDDKQHLCTFCGMIFTDLQAYGTHYLGHEREIHSINLNNIRYRRNREMARIPRQIVIALPAPSFEPRTTEDKDDQLAER